MAPAHKFNTIEQPFLQPSFRGAAANVHRKKTQKVTVIEAKAQSILAGISVPIYPSD
jgi:hypothetical protein